MSYMPTVGDVFHKPAGTAPGLFGTVVETPERTAKITAMSARHVVCVIDGKEYTMPVPGFIHLAEKTLVNGATLLTARTPGGPTP